MCSNSESHGEREHRPSQNPRPLGLGRFSLMASGLLARVSKTLRGLFTCWQRRPAIGTKQAGDVTGPYGCVGGGKYLIEFFPRKTGVFLTG